MWFIMFVTNKKGGICMTNFVDIKNLAQKLSVENKRYVIAVVNALLFSQKPEKQNQPPKPPTNQKPA